MMENGQDLLTLLFHASLEDLADRNQSFLPNTKLDELVTEVSIKRELECHCPRHSDLAFVVSQSARRLFVILLRINALQHLPALVSDGLKDIHLPLDKYSPNPSSPREYKLRKQGYSTGCSEKEFEIEAMRKWTVMLRDEFSAKQWHVLAPVLNDGHNDLHESHILPFIYDGHTGSDAVNGGPISVCGIKYGGFGQVWAVKIHFAHERLFAQRTVEGKEPLIAVKHLVNATEKEFQQETHMLRELRSKNHPHLVKLLATYKWKNKYYMLFPFASGNLRQFWTEHVRNPPYEPTIIRWYLEQMKGIASALSQIHQFKPNSVVNQGTEQNLLSPNVVDDYERFGRHGDVKPENILWEKNSTNEGHLGTLVIADFGLARFHRHLSRSNIPTNLAIASPTYEPPEMRVGKRISRKYDMWSMGCVFLEYTIWLLAGAEGLDQFTEARSEHGIDGVDDDTFYSIRTNGVAEPRQAIVDWVSKMYNHRRCSRAIHDVLDLIFDKLLPLDPDRRATSIELQTRLQEISARADEDEIYLAGPVPSSRKFPSVLHSSATLNGSSRLHPPGHNIRSPPNVINAGPEVMVNSKVFPNRGNPALVVTHE